MYLLYSDVSVAASVAIATLNRIGITACFVGGMACKLYGNNRTPGDIDILCLGCPWDQEELKRQLVATNSSFYLVMSKTPGATYKVLWYRTSHYSSWRCKVDLLFPGTMNIPSIPSSAIEHPEPGRPCAPFALVFLLKLQAWVQHRDSEELRFRLKSSTDAMDLRTMLPIARAKGVDIRRTGAHLPPSFVAAAGPRVKRFVREWPETKTEWRALGFSV